MRRFLIFGGFLAAIAAFTVGCQKPEEAAAPVTISSEGFELTEADIRAIDAVMNEQKGKVVLVDFWATWCPPCVKKFPHFVQTHKKFAEKGLVCISVSGDGAGPSGKADKRAVLEFLKENGANFKNFLLTGYQKDAAAIGRRFGFEGSLPFVALFGKDGKRVWDSEQKRLDDGELDKLIEAELAK